MDEMPKVRYAVMGGRCFDSKELKMLTPLKQTDKMYWFEAIIPEGENISSPKFSSHNRASIFRKEMDYQIKYLCMGCDKKKHLCKCLRAKELAKEKARDEYAKVMINRQIEDDNK